MLRNDVSEKIGAAHILRDVESVIKVLSIHFDTVRPFINFDNRLGFSCADVSVFLECGYQVMLGGECFFAANIIELNEMITNHRKNKGD